MKKMIALVLFSSFVSAASYADVAIHVLSCHSAKNKQTLEIKYVMGMPIPGSRKKPKGLTLAELDQGKKSLVSMAVEAASIPEIGAYNIQSLYKGEEGDTSITLTVAKVNSDLGGYKSLVTTVINGKQKQYEMGCYYTK